LSNASYTDGHTKIGVDPVSLDGQRHGRQLELLDLVDAWDDQCSASDNHGRGAVHEPGDDHGLVGAYDLDLHVEAHLEATDLGPAPYVLCSLL